MTAARFIRILRQVPFLLWTAIVLVPFALILMFSFRNNSDLFAFPFGIGGSYHPENYAVAWAGPTGTSGMADFFRNTGIAAGIAVAVILVAGSLAAYFITRLAPKVQGALLLVFIVASVVPFVLLVIPYFQVFNGLGLLNQPAVMGVIYGVLNLPTTVLIMTAFYADFPGELIEAANVDGLGEFAAYVKIVLPMSKGALTAVGLLTLVHVWGEAQLGIVLLQSASSQTVTVGMLGFQGQFVSQLGPIFAGLSIGTVPLIAIYLVFNRFITKGLALGGVFR